EEAAAYPAEEPTNQLFIQPSIVNVRAAASQGSAVLTQLPRKQPVVELERKKGWVLIAWPDDSGQRGWIHSSLLAAQPAVPNQP
ncbi:MAG: SH3 domain-containing protein, partial [Kiloniellales bacterium]|nr:SH3 domain-containing protein [Kiloniellales bacterium]